MSKFQDKYRIASTRLQNWDYAWNGAYFITICTKGKICCFGDIVDKRIRLSKVGVIADVLWFEIKNHSRNVDLGPFVVMPNHVHGIIVLTNRGRHVETGHALSPASPKGGGAIGRNRFQNQSKSSISSIVGAYKSAVTRHARRLGFDFAWQSRFHDHIIRDEKSYLAAADYILTNCAKWETDEYFA